MRFCFTLFCGIGLAGGSTWAADAPAPAAPVKSVIKTDARTGKLVRRLVTAPQPATASPTPATIAPTLATASSTLAAVASTPPVVSPTSAPAAPTPTPTAPAAFSAAVDRAAARQALPPELLHSVIKVESNYNPYAISPKGAQGLMQLIPETARRFGVSDAFDPVENIEGGAKYLKYLLDLYKGDYPRALAAYNAGEGAVAKYKGVPPYAETQNYVARVQKRIDQAGKKPAAPAVVKEAALAKEKEAQAKEETNSTVAAAPQPKHIEAVVEADGQVHYVSK